MPAGGAFRERVVIAAMRFDLYRPAQDVEKLEVAVVGMPARVCAVRVGRADPTRTEEAVGCFAESEVKRL